MPVQYVAAAVVVGIVIGMAFTVIGFFSSKPVFERTSSVRFCYTEVYFYSDPIY